MPEMSCERTQRQLNNFSKSVYNKIAHLHRKTNWTCYADQTKEGITEDTKGVLTQEVREG